MEANKAGAPIMTVIYPGVSNFDKNHENEVELVTGNNEEQKSVEKDVAAPSKDQNNEEKQNDDEDSVIIEEVQNKTIELDEDSADEETEVTLDQGPEELSNATEFVVVNAANISTADIVEDIEATNKYAIEEDIQIKDELAETITADLNTNDVLENDPMDLLELNTRSDSSTSTRSQEDTEYGDDVSSVGSSSIKTGLSSTTNVLDWIKDYPWLLYEDGYEPFGYCLYCDAKLNIKSLTYAKQHCASLYHKERCENYLAFRDEEEKNGLSMKLVEIKEEFGTDSRVEALKLKRKSQSGAINNFNWRRWLKDCPWLERDSAEGTTGYCKYCHIHVNVEFSYLRDRHQEGVKHKEAEKQYEESNKSNEVTDSNEQIKDSNVGDENRKETSTDNDQTKKWLEIVKADSLIVRCKLCCTEMLKNNFLRHLRTNLHEQNEKAYIQSQATAKQNKIDEETVKKPHYWHMYAKEHPWLVPDPTEPTTAYCKYCEKRIVYGASAAKRSLHENSSQHKLKESEFINKSRKDSDKEGEQANSEVDNDEKSDEEAEEEQEDQEDNEEVEEENDEETDEEGECDDEDEDAEDEEENEDDEDGKKENQQGKDSDDENDLKKRVYRLSEEWFNQYSWCKKYNKNPTDFFYCIYCKIPLKVASNRLKHQTTSFHISSEKKFWSRQDKKQKQLDKKVSNETTQFFEWAIHLKNNPGSYSCRYCRVRISKNYSKKQHASSKIHQINESIYKDNRRKSLRKDDNANSNSSQQTPKVVTQQANVPTTKKIQTFAKVVLKAPSTVTLIKQWQKKFPWLSYKRSELRSNYGHCKICDSSLYIRSLKHVLRHLRSQRHTSILKANKKQKVEKAIEDDVGDNNTSSKLAGKGPKEELQASPGDGTEKNQTNQVTPTANAVTTEFPKAYNYKSTIVEMKKRFSWIEKSDRPNYVFCRFCNTNIPLKILILRSHSNSQKHRQCVINYRGGRGESRIQNNAISDDNRDNGKNVNNDIDDDDLMIVEENNEEILISEQDENWTVKSEIMDEHEELDYLLQRSFNNNQNKSNTQRCVRKSISAAEGEPPTKRIKRSQSFRRFNDSNTSLVASLLSTPLTLASCLGPLIQQQIQQQANISQTSIANNDSTTTKAGAQQTTPAPSAAEPENTYDLFFKSISETMKKLPVDLAAEGKLRVMQIICDLELQALKRQQSNCSESASSNSSAGGLSYQPTSTSAGIQPSCNSSVIPDITAEQNGNVNESMATQISMGADLSPPLINQPIPPSTLTNSNCVEKPAATPTNATSPVIGVMDKNGLHTLQWRKTAVTKQVSRNTTNTSVNSVANTGIRCIPFKNLSQNTTPETPPNTKVTRIQMPLNVTTQSPNPNVNTVNFRNIQITKRIGTPPNSTAVASNISQHQQTVSQASTMVKKSPQRTYITNIQPQLQRWGCSMNGTAQQTPTSSAVTHLQQLSTQKTSTPISKKH